MRDEQAEVLHAATAGEPDGHGIRRRRGLETDRKEHDTTVRPGGGDLHGVQRGVDDAHVVPLGLQTQQVTVRSRHPQHVAERAERHVGT